MTQIRFRGRGLAAASQPPRGAPAADRVAAPTGDGCPVPDSAAGATLGSVSATPALPVIELEGGTVDGFSQRHDDPSLANPNRPIWIVNQTPFDADSVLTNTWSFGPVGPGQTINREVTGTITQPTDVTATITVEVQPEA